MSPFYYEHFEDMSYETAYETYFENAHEVSCEDSREDSGQTSGLSLQEQDDLSQQRLRDEKHEDHEKTALTKDLLRMAALSAARARGGRTVNEQRHLFHEKSRSFALDPTKARDPLPTAVGGLTLRQLAFQRVQAASVSAAPVVTPASVAVPVVVAPASAVVPAAVVPFVESGCGAMFDIFAEYEDFVAFREMFALPDVLASPKAVTTIQPIVVRTPAYDVLSEEDAIFSDLFTAPVVLGALTVPYIPASAEVAPVVTTAIAHDIFTDDDLFGGMFAIPAVLGAPTVPYIPTSPAVKAPTAVVSSVVAAATPVVFKKLSKHEQAVRRLKLMNKGSAMSELIQIYKEMEADGRITYPAPDPEPVAVAPAVPDLGPEEVSSGSEKGSIIGSPSSQSSLSDGEGYLRKIQMTPMPTPTKTKEPRPETPVKAIPMNALPQTPSPLRLEAQEKIRPDSPTTSKLTCQGKKTFTPSLAAIESSPTASPTTERSPPASLFVRPGKPTPTKATRGARNFAPVLSSIRADDFEEEDEEPSSPRPMLLGGVLPTTTTYVGDIEVESQSIAKSAVPTVEELIQKVQETEGHVTTSTAHTHAPEIPATTKAAPETGVEEPHKVPLTNIGAMATIACSYLVAQSVRIAPVAVSVLVAGVAFAAYRFFLW
ncbi:hypothetical protein Vi05172_g4900 [Venturia inaequalis]|nr:hypothetical protein Vi05172_g4900 [Venturia inaequalis]